MIFKLETDEYFAAKQHNYYEVEAETLEEALNMIENQDVDPKEYGIIEVASDAEYTEMEIMNEQCEILRTCQV